jgi:hypothetical protein
MKIACKMKQKMIDFWLIVLNMVHRELKFIGYVMVIEFCYDSNCFIDWICMKIDFVFVWVRIIWINLFIVMVITHVIFKCLKSYV